MRARCLVVYRAEPAAVQCILPERLRARCVQGFAIAAACYTRLGAPPLFRRRAEDDQAGSDHLAFRIAVEQEDGSPATWIARRETSSWLEARCGKRLLRGEYGRSSFRLKEDAFALELSVAGERGEAFYLRAETAPGIARSLFTTPGALGAFLGEDRPVRPYDIFAPEADELDLAEHFAPVPLVVFEERCPFLRAEPLAPGAAELDSAWRIQSRRLAAAPQRRPAFRVLPGSSPALPTA